jgi:START domain
MPRLSSAPFRAWWLLIFLACGAALGAPGDWVFLYEREGIRAYERPGSPMTYRAEISMDAPIIEVAAVLSDIPRQKEWVDHLVENRIVEGDPFSHYVLYSRFHLPWPAADREAVTDNQIQILPKEGRVLLKYHALPQAPVSAARGSVRVPRSEGEFLMVETGPRSVHISYTLCLDPGGHLPEWLVRLFVQNAPLTTLRAMRAQILRTRGDYAIAIADLRRRWEPGQP